MDKVKEVKEVHGLIELFQSKHFWMAVGTVLAMVANAVWGNVSIQPETIAAIGVAVMTSHAFIDAAKHISQGKSQ